MQIKNFHITKNSLLITYKLSYDLLLLLLLTFAVTLIAESLLPGLISSKISLTKLSFAIFLILSLIIYLGKNFGISYEISKINKNKILPPLILFSFLLIGSSLLKFTLWENIIITITTLFVFFLFYELIFIDKEK